MKNHNKISFIFIASIISVIIGVITNLLIPNLLSSNDGQNIEYGDYRRFIFILSYLCIFHLGFINGSYVKISTDKDIEENKLILYRSSFIIFIFFQIIFNVLLGLIDLIFFHSTYKWIILVFFFYNLEALLVKLLNSKVNTLVLGIYEIFNKVFILIIVLLMYFNFISRSAILLIISTIFMHIVAAVFLFVFYRKWFIGKIDLKKGINMLKECMVIGFPLLLSYFTVLFITSSFSIFVDYYYKDHYSNYQFVYSMMALVTGLLSYFSGLILPLINKMSCEKYNKAFHNIILLIQVIFALIVGFLFIITPALSYFFEKYIGSHMFFVLSIPLLYFQIVYFLVIQPFYQNKYWQKKLLVINVLIALFILIMNLICCNFIKNPFFMLIINNISYLTWNVISLVLANNPNKIRIIRECFFGCVLIIVTCIYYYINPKEFDTKIIISVIFFLVLLILNIDYIINIFIKKERRIINE